MDPVTPISATALGDADPVARDSVSQANDVSQANGISQANSVDGTSFWEMFRVGLEAVEVKVDRSDELVRQFALGGDIPVHQVMIALEEARLAVELAVQVRSRLVEGYRTIMNMQM